MFRTLNSAVTLLCVATYTHTPNVLHCAPFQMFIIFKSSRNSSGTHLYFETIEQRQGVDGISFIGIFSRFLSLSRSPSPILTVVSFFSPCNVRHNGRIEWGTSATGTAVSIESK